MSVSDSSYKDIAEEDAWVPLKQRNAQRLSSIQSRIEPSARRTKTLEEEEKARLDRERLEAEDTFFSGPRSKKSLFQEYLSRDESKIQQSEEAKIAKEEATIFAAMTQDIPLQSVAQRAHGVVFTETIKASWKPPTWIRERSEAENTEIRAKLKIDTDGESVPPPIERFIDLKLPQPIYEVLQKRKISNPSPIQIQGLPVILSGRDMIGVAHTGSGKTLVFSIPALMYALEEEMRYPVKAGEGPISLILAPSRELASQTNDLICEMTTELAKSNFPVIISSLLIGGTSTRDQERTLTSGCHIVVATPGRLIQFLKDKKISLLFCKYLCLDEADRLIDAGFEEDIRYIMDHFAQTKQTVLFSATMPKTIQTFARSALINPIEVNVGRAGAASLNILQEVEYVTQELKIVYLLESLQKTPPPVLIFCENKNDVDSIHEYLLVKGVRAVAIHGGKEQTDRLKAVQLFRAGEKDVLIATDVASKGLDFPQIQHVINFDMPKEIENYVHRIGRTGRGGHTGVATTFINKTCTPTILMDLKQLLIEAKQRLPPFLENFELEYGLDGPMPESVAEGLGCTFCGGLGHRISNCPKVTNIRNKQISSTTGTSRGYRGDGGGY